MLKSRTESDLSLKDYNRYKNALLNDYKENGIDISALSEQELNDKVLEEAMSDVQALALGLSAGANSKYGYVSINQVSNDLYAITNIDGEVVYKSAEQIGKRYIDASKDVLAQKTIQPNFGKRSPLSSGRGVKFDLKRDNRGNTYWEIESDKDIFQGLATKEELRDAAYKFLLGNRDNKVVLTDGNGNNIEFIRLSADEFTYGRGSQELYASTNDNLNIYEKKCV